MKTAKTLLNSFVMVGCLVLLGAGCMMKQIPRYNPALPSSTSSSRESRGIRVTVDPFLDKARTEQFFRVHAIKEGIAILHLQVSNSGPAATVLVNKDDFKILFANSDASGSAVEVDRDTAAGEAVALTGAALISLPMLFAGGKLLSDASVVRHNFTSNEFHSQTLAPGETAEGFVYFQVDRKKHPSFDGTFVFAFRHLQTQSTETLRFPITYTAHE